MKFQLGTLMVLTDESQNGRQLIEDAQKNGHIQELADELFALAMGMNANGCRQQTEVKQISDYMPEDRGLASCRLALGALQRNSFQEALDLTLHVRRVNKMHRDFGWALGFHAKKRLDRQFNYKTVQPLACIAKRGSRLLKTTVHAIAQDQFDHASKLGAT